MTNTKIPSPVYTSVSLDPFVRCQYLTKAAFDHPFFNDGVYHPKDQWIQPIDLLLEDLAHYPGPKMEVKGFIFHTAHCGSTLLGRMLGVSENVQVVSETEAMNGLLRSSNGFVNWWDHPNPLLWRYFLGGDVQIRDKEEYWQMVKAGRFHADMAKNDSSLFISYPDFLSFIEKKILPHFRLSFSADEMATSLERKKYDAKKMNKDFFKT